MRMRTSRQLQTRMSFGLVASGWAPVLACGNLGNRHIDGESQTGVVRIEALPIPIRIRRARPERLRLVTLSHRGALLIRNHPRCVQMIGQ